MRLVEFRRQSKNQKYFRIKKSKIRDRILQPKQQQRQYFYFYGTVPAVKGQKIQT